MRTYRLYACQVNEDPKVPICPGAIRITSNENIIASAHQDAIPIRILMSIDHPIAHLQRYLRVMQTPVCYVIHFNIVISK